MMSNASQVPSVIESTTTRRSFITDMTLNFTSQSPSNFTADDLVRLNDAKARVLIPAMTVLGVLMVVGIVGNTLVCYVFCFRFKRGTQNFLIVCLAVFDLLSCTIAIPNEIADMRYYYMFVSEAACKIIRFINTFTAIGSILTLLVIAIDRFRKICKPFKNQLHMKHAKLSLIPVLGLALLVAWPAFIMYGNRTTETEIPGLNGYDCSTPDEVKDTIYPLLYNGFLFIAFIILAITLIVLYSLILRETKRHNKYMRKNSDFHLPSGVSGCNNTEDSESNIVVNPDASIVCYSPPKGIVRGDKGVFRYSSETLSPNSNDTESQSFSSDVAKSLKKDEHNKRRQSHYECIMEPPDRKEKNIVTAAGDRSDTSQDKSQTCSGSDAFQDKDLTCCGRDTSNNESHTCCVYDTSQDKSHICCGSGSGSNTSQAISKTFRGSHNSQNTSQTFCGSDRLQDTSQTYSVGDTLQDETPTCCGSDTSQDKSRTCCGSDTSQDISRTCCGSDTSQDKSRTCCGSDTLQDTSKTCCGSDTLQDTSKTCCGSDTLQDTSKTCCGSDTLQDTSQTCCGSDTLQDTSKTCCGSDTLQDTSKTCCGSDTLQDTSKTCCGSDTLQDTSQTCCGSDTLQDTSKTCCGSDTLQDTSKTCCGSDTLQNTSQTCCGSDTLQNTSHTCCGSDTLQNTSQTCCGSDTLQNTSQTCCGGDTTQHTSLTDYNTLQSGSPAVCVNFSNEMSPISHQNDSPPVTFPGSSVSLGLVPSEGVHSCGTSATDKPTVGTVKETHSRSDNKIFLLKPKPSFVQKNKMKTKPKRYKSKTTIIAFLVTLVFILSFLPHLCLQVAKMIYKDFDYNLSDSGLVAYNLFLRSYFINSVSNPIIYGALNAQFSTEVKSSARKVYWKLQSLCHR